MRAPRALGLTAATLLSAGTLAACGDDATFDPTPAPAPKATGGEPAVMGAMAMSSLAATTQQDVRVGLEAMAPETFFVAEGATQRKQAPTPDDTAHMMVTLADARSGIRLPDATVTLSITGPDGRSVFDGPLYPMLGRAMGMHYGENVALRAPGTYTARLVAGPPRIGRHADSAQAWTRTVRVTQRFAWDGTTAKPVS